MEKVENMQEQMGNINKEMEMLGKNQKEMLKIKSTQNDYRPKCKMQK